MTVVGLRRAGRVPIYVQVAEDLEGAMLRGEYGVGDRLPTEHALAAEYGINRHTAGQALNHLQNKGLVVRVRGRGTFVRPGRVDYRVAEKMSFTDSVSRVGLRPSRKILGVRSVRAFGRIPGAMGVPAGEPLVARESVSFAGEIPLDYSVKHFREVLFPGAREILRQPKSSRALIKAHHGVEDWKLDGQTNIDDLTLACGPNNRLIEDTEWTTRRGPDGRFEWVPPPHLDTGQRRTNNLHHPERLLRHNDEDDDPL